MAGKSHDFEAVRIAAKYSFAGFDSGFAALNEAESVLPDTVLFNLHLDMIVNGGMRAVSEYHRLLLKGTNLILERVRPHLVKSDIIRLDEAISVFTKKLNEEGELAPPEFLQGEFNNIATPSAGSDDDSFLSLANLKRLWSLATEDSSPFGIFQFILDLFGMFGDFAIPGVGVAADLLNAAIYFVRSQLPGAPEGMVMMGIISAFSAIPGFGMIGPLLKSGAKSAAPVIRHAVSGSTELAIREMGRIAPESAAAQFLNLIKTSGVKLLTKLTEGILNIGRWLADQFRSVFPSAAAKIESMFKGIADTINTVNTRLKKFFAGDPAVAQKKKMFKDSVKDAEKTLADLKASGGGKWTYDKATDIVTVLDASGTVVKTIPGGVVISAWKKKLPNLFNSGVSREVSQNIPDYAGALNSTTRQLSRILNATRIGRRALLRIGIFIIKYGWLGMTAKDASQDDQLPPGFTEDDALGIGGIGLGQGTIESLEDYTKRRRKEELEETGASHIPFIELSSREKGAVDVVHGEINKKAKDLGMPEVIDVAYNRFKNDAQMQQFTDFWEAVKQGKVKANEDGTGFYRVDEQPVAESRLIHIVSYSKFV